jgi:L-lactate dehydrogenase complex protein LldF
MAARGTCAARSCAAQVAVSGANFAVAETGTLSVVESEGNGRMCLTLPQTLITVMGIEKLVPTWTDLEVFLQLLPRSSTGERMNPYTSMWTGVTPGDGPQEFHLVLLDNGRTACWPTRSAGRRCTASAARPA